MSRVHDMGGRFGDGPVVPEPEGEVFHEPWHGRALALTISGAYVGKWNIDMGRFAREALAPQDYARFSYYEKWISALADMLEERGLVTRDELAGGAVTQAETAAEGRLTADAVAAGIARGNPSLRDSDVAATFAPGDRVRVRARAGNRLVPGGHTRQPDYVSGAVGRILRMHGAHVLPDSNAHGLGEASEPLYAVAFPASELWVHPEHPRDEVVLDLWQSYLEAP